MYREIVSYTHPMCTIKLYTLPWRRDLVATPLFVEAWVVRSNPARVYIGC
jgi:hypothetical protein